MHINPGPGNDNNHCFEIKSRPVCALCKNLSKFCFLELKFLLLKSKIFKILLLMSKTFKILLFMSKFWFEVQNLSKIWFLKFKIWVLRSKFVSFEVFMLKFFKILVFEVQIFGFFFTRMRWRAISTFCSSPASVTEKKNETLNNEYFDRYYHGVELV